MTTKTIKTVLVNVKRGMQTIPAEIMPHELPVLKAVHLPENVQIVQKDYGEIEVPDSAVLEFRRLQAKYDARDRARFERIYASAEDLADATGFALADEPLESEAVIVRHAKEPKVKTKEPKAA